MHLKPVSLSYDKDWVLGATEDKRDASYPTIVYAYSVKRGDNVSSDGYDVYWFSEDDSYPIVEGSCNSLFQNSPVSYLEDASGIADWVFQNITSMKAMFANCNNLKSVVFHNVSNTTSLNDIFDKCSNLESIELKGDYSKVTSLNIFGPSKNTLKTVALNGNFSGLTSMKQVFYNYNSLCNVSIEGDFSNVTDISYLFDGCSSIPSASVNSDADAAVKITADLSKVTSFLCLFRNCASLTSATINLSAFPNVTNMDAVFEGCAETSFSMGGGPADITVEGEYNKIISLAWLLKNGKRLKTVSLIGDFSKVTSFKEFTNGCSALENLTLDGDFSSLTTLEKFSDNCSSMKNSVIKGDFSSLTDNIKLFYSGCPNIQTVVLDGDFPKANEGSFNEIFKDKKSLKTLTVKGNYNSLTTMRFFTKNCTALETLVLEGDFGKLKNLEASFEDCHSLVTADVNIASTQPSSNLTMISWAFKNDKSLKTLNLQGDFSHVTTMQETFLGNTSLESVTINGGNADFSSLTNMFRVVDGLDFASKYSVFSSILSQMNIDINKMPGGTNDNHKISSNKNWTAKKVRTKNVIDYTLANGYLNAALLPIELTYFTVSQESDNIIFTWETASEENNDFFTIEQSIDGVFFNELVEINGAGTTSARTLYEYAMPLDIDGIAYFRLKQTDYNGECSYSDVQTLSPVREYVRMYPIPAFEYITIDGEYCNVRFVDQQGRIHTPARMDGNTYPLESYPQGVYYAIITMKDGTIIKRQFIKR